MFKQAIAFAFRMQMTIKWLFVVFILLAAALLSEGVAMYIALGISIGMLVFIAMIEYRDYLFITRSHYNAISKLFRGFYDYD